MKIVHLVNHVKCSGNGIINMMTDLACCQADSGDNVMVASAGGDYLSTFSEHSVRHTILNQRPIKKWQIPGMLWGLFKIIRDFRPDIIHAHMVTGMLAAKFLQPFGKYKIVSTVHNEFENSARFMGRADIVVGVSEVVSEAMRKRGTPPDALRTVYNGIVGSPRLRRAGLTDVVLAGEQKIVTVAGLNKRKGIDVLISAFAQILPDFPHAVLYIVGDGPDRGEFEKLSEDLSITSNVSFEGFQENSFSYLRQSDVFVLASHRDPFPLVILEAREAGCAIIASAVDGIPEALAQGRAGVLVDAGNVAQLAGALRAMLSDPLYRNSMKAMARTDIEWMSVVRMEREYKEIYRSLTASN